MPLRAIFMGMTEENTQSEEQPIFEDDPILGRFVAQYPANRLRLLIRSGGVLSAVWFVVTVALWNVEDGLAAALTVLIITPVALLAGWYVLHLWNREVILYAKGFTYRRGSQLGYIHYSDVIQTRQTGGIIRYLGGIVKRNTFRFTVITIHDEVLPFTALYKNLDDLTLKLEAEIYRVLSPKVTTQLDKGERVAFGEGFYISINGIHCDNRDLSWDDFGGQRIKDGALHLNKRDGTSWHTRPLEDVDNIRLLLALLGHYQTKQE